MLLGQSRSFTPISPRSGSQNRAEVPKIFAVDDPPLTFTVRPSTISSLLIGTGATTGTDGEHDCYLRQRDTWRELIVAWFRPMGSDEVACHQTTVVGREDDHPGTALAYYGSRGETPLRWGGTGAARLGLIGQVTGLSRNRFARRSDAGQSPPLRYR